MPYNSDKIIYVDTTASPQEGISIGDIQAVLGSSANDIGQLIANGLINKWAKYKPVKKAGLDFPNERNADFTWKTSATWWKAYDGQCGLTFETFPSLGTNTMSTSNTFFHDLLAGDLGWGYERPSGGIGQYPYRFFDFLYYSHYAPKPVTGVYDNLRLYDNGKLTVQLDENRAQDNLGIQLSDLVIGQSAVSGWYVGVLIWRSNSEFTFAFSENTLGGNGSLDVEFTGMTSYGGRTAKIVPFLASQRANQGVDPGGGVYLSCDVTPQDVTIAAEVVAVVMTIDAQWKDTFHARVGYVVNIINNTTSQISVNNLKISLYDGYQNVDTDNEGNITVAARSNQEFSGILFPGTYDSSRTYSVVVSSSRSEVNGSKEVDDPRQ